MKTSELKKLLSNWGYTVSEEGNVDELWLIVKRHGLTLCHVGVYSRELRTMSTNFNDAYDLKALTSIITYLETPLNEREEQKKYYLKFPQSFDSFKYLNFNTLKKAYGRSLEGSSDFDVFKVAFTQKEIDAMPFDTKFFIKEEVKE